MKVIFVITGLGLGGAETQLVRLSTQLQTRGWDVQVVSMTPLKAYVEELRAVGIPVYCLEMRRGVPDPRAIFRLARILRREQPEVVHSFMVHANLLARVTRLLATVPVLICSAHSIDEGGRWRERLYRLTDPLCDLTTQVSQAGMKRYIEVGAAPADKIRFMPNGVDTSIFRPAPEARETARGQLGVGNSFVWLAVGRFEPPKDYPNLLRAFAEVIRQRSDASLLVVGDGPLQPAMQNLASELGIADHVEFLGIRRDVPQLMNAADAYVMSSAWEGMPNVLLEAAACALPIVATDVGGNREVAVDGETGFLVPPQDHCALADAMLRLMCVPPEIRTQMGEGGRRHIEANYSLHRMVERWEELYRELLARKGIRIDTGAQ